MRRCAVIGASGSGKSTLAGQVAHSLDVERIDLDELFHGPGWSLPETPELRRRITEALDRADADRGGWVVSGNYSTTADIVHGRADTIVWLDLPRWRSTSRVIRRSLKRAATRQELWGGNRERFRNLVSRDPATNIIVWAWTSHPRVRSQYEALARSPLWARATVHRLTSVDEVTRFENDPTLSVAERHS